MSKNKTIYVARDGETNGHNDKSLTQFVAQPIKKFAGNYPYWQANGANGQSLNKSEYPETLNGECHEYELVYKGKVE